MPIKHFLFIRFYSSFLSSPTEQHLINPRRACAARVTVIVLSVCQSVSVSVHDYSRTAGNVAASE